MRCVKELSTMKRCHQNESGGSSSSKSQRFSPDKIQENYTKQIIESKRHEYFTHKESSRTICGEGNIPESLADLSAKVCAFTLPYEALEEKYIHVPEPVMKKFILHAFPRCENDIRRYSSICYCSQEEGCKRKGCHFEKGISMVEKNKVKNVLQIGFRLMGEVEISGEETKTKSNCQVSITFDRCKISSKTCGCDEKTGILLCSHVIALALFRIRFPHLITYRPPMSDTLQQLGRNQLQKLTQYILAQHPEVLATTHTVVELLVNLKSDLNKMEGAPDPTSGAAMADDDRWAIGEDETKLNLTNLLESDDVLVASRKLQVILTKVCDMMRSHDRNGPYLLTHVTEELLKHLLSYTDKKLCIAGWRSVWEKIGKLWTCVVLNPRVENSANLTSTLTEWESRLTAAEFLEEKQRAELEQLVHREHSIFSFAMKASSIGWDDEKVRNILRLSSPLCKAVEKFESDTKMFQIPTKMSWRDEPPVFSNSTPMTEHDIENLLRHDLYRSPIPMTEHDLENLLEKMQEEPSLLFNEEPLDLSKSKEKAGPSMTLPYATEGVSRISKSLQEPCKEINTEDRSLLWHEPLQIAIPRVEALIFNGYQREAKVLALTIALTIKHEYARYLSNPEQNLNTDPVIEDYKHQFELVEILVANLLDKEKTQENPKEPVNETCDNYKNLAFEIILISLANRTCPASDSTEQVALLKRGIVAESALIRRLKSYELNEYRNHVIESISSSLLREFDVLSVEEKDFLPFYSLASYLSENLWSKTMRLSISKRALECPLSQNFAALTDPESESSALHKRYYGKHHHPETAKTFIENQMGADLLNLAMNLIKTARDLARLQEILECLLQNVENPDHLLQLSREAFKIAKETDGLCDIHMVDAAVELCKQTLKLTIDEANSSRKCSREEMIKFLFVCASESGFKTIESILTCWCYHFTPTEAVNSVAKCLSSSSTSEVLNHNLKLKDELQEQICRMAINCLIKEPEPCALTCLKLCEKHPDFFPNAYAAIEEATRDNRINPCELYQIAKYLNDCEFAEWALTMGLAATCRLDIGIGAERHPLIDDLMWTIELCLGKPDLVENLIEDLLMAVHDNVKSPTILTKILKIFTEKKDSSDATQTEEKKVHGFPADSPVLQPLVEAAVSAFTEAIHEKLRSITPGRYMEFVIFFKQAHETFLVASNGHERFEELKSNLVTVHKRKKKLIKLIQQQFNEENTSSG